MRLVRDSKHVAAEKIASAETVGEYSTRQRRVKMQVGSLQFHARKARRMIEGRPRRRNAAASAAQQQQPPTRIADSWNEKVSISWR